MKHAIAAAALAAATAALIGTSAVAAPLARRDHNIAQRIEQGRRDGSLTRQEAYTLQNRLWRLEWRENYARRNGLSMTERRNLQQSYDALSNQVWRQRHDTQRADRWYNHHWR